MKRLLYIFLLTAVFTTLLVSPAHALEYTIDAPDDYLFGQPTSDDTVYEWTEPNVDRSKNTALIPPGFGTPTSYLPGSGEYLTPNLVPGALSGGSVNQVGGSSGTGTPVNAGGSYPAASASTVTVDSSGYPTVDIGVSGQAIAFTDVASSMYYSDGSLGTLRIPSISLTVKVYEGTDTAALTKGAGHFEDTSIWNGNIALAGHNRGAHACFGSIHTLKAGSTISLTTALGTRTYAVTGVYKVSVNDISGLSATADNQITLYTCVRDQPDYRWCVKGVEI